MSTAFHITRVDYQNPQHAKDLLSLLDEYARHPMGGGKALPNDTRNHLVPALAQIPYAFSVLAYHNDKAVGLVNCFQGFSTFKCQPLINIHDVMVTENYRGRGLTRLLFAQVEAIARARNCCKMTLEVLEGNPQAQRAYRNLGFESYELDPVMGQAMFWEKVFE